MGTNSIKRIAVTGGAGQIAYSLLFRLAKGELFKNQKIILQILETPSSIDALKGVVMELNDCSYPLLQEIKIGTDPMEVFEGADLAFLIGAKPRGPGMERKELLKNNGKIFIDQGKALNKVASKDVRVLIVGNPCNTNCLICMRYAPDLDRKQFFSMTRLDQNRATFQLAQKADVSIEEVKHVAIWGNHSSTQVPDYFNAIIQKKPVHSVIQDEKWLQNDFYQTVQKRGSSIIEARGKSSAASAANAALDTFYSLLYPKIHEWFSAGIYSAKNPYNIDEDLVFSFPLQATSSQNVDIVKGLKFDDFISEKIKETEQELKEERDLIRHLL